MKTFKLDHNGDVSITYGSIDMVSGIGVIVQTLKQVLGTNLKEWFLDPEEGIDYSVILTKNPNADLMRDTIHTAAYKVADQLGVELEIDNFNYSINGRTLAITLDINLSTGESETVSLSL